MSLFEKSKSEWIIRYIYQDPGRSTPRMDLGKQMAEMLEKGEESTDKDFEFYRTFLPSYPEREYKIEANFDGVPILGKFDGWDEQKNHLGEFKTGAKWTQKMVDGSGQLSFYALLIFLKYGKLPDRITLHWMPTVIDQTGLHLTGDLTNFETRRTPIELAAIGARIKKTWKEIVELSAKEYDSLGL